MPDIYLDVPIKAPIERVFGAISTPEGLETWWTKRSTGIPQPGATCELWFGPEHDWRAQVVRCIAGAEFELEMTQADRDFLGMHVGFRLDAGAPATWVHFHHTSWAGLNAHYRISCNCRAMHHRVMRRPLEHGETALYDRRLDT